MAPMAEGSDGTVTAGATGRRYVTTDFVLSELIAHLYTTLTAQQAQDFINHLLATVDAGIYYPGK